MNKFLSRLSNLNRFEEFVEDSFYQQVPNDWLVYTTDIVGSTAAIDVGKYRDVNTVGAASIVAVQNVIGDDFLYVFGGDGAAIVVDPIHREKVSMALGALKRVSSSNFGLEMRVGMVPVILLESQGSMLEVAKLPLSGGRSISMFRGGGLALADSYIKSAEEFDIPESDSECNLEGLSCRWQPIPTSKGCILSMIVQGQTHESYSRVVESVQRALGHSIEEANPVQPASMSYRSVWENLKSENRFHTKKSVKWLSRIVEIFVAGAIFKLGFPALIFSREAYRASMRTHSDFRKFDDSLRMIIECTPKQSLAIEAELDRLTATEGVVYGVHRSDHALMTCYFGDADPGGHVHFIDGGNGGYALAARDLKEKLSARPDIKLAA